MQLELNVERERERELVQISCVHVCVCVCVCVSKLTEEDLHSVIKIAEFTMVLSLPTQRHRRCYERWAVELWDINLESHHRVLHYTRNYCN